LLLLGVWLVGSACSCWVSGLWEVFVTAGCLVSLWEVFVTAGCLVSLWEVLASAGSLVPSVVCSWNQSFLYFDFVNFFNKPIMSFCKSMQIHG
jgi:hypothetical protein